jgi:F-type H+-transporting ATPase subunit a
MAAGNPLDPAHLIEHVQDAYYFEVPRWFTGDSPQPPPGLEGVPRDQLIGKIFIPQPFGRLTSLHGGEGFLISKFMLLEVVAALLLLAVFVPLARKVRDGKPVRGRLANLLEAILVFIRDNVARPAIGKHDADRFLPFLWTLFFFILFCNLLGLVPWLGTVTGALGATAALAVISFLCVVGSGMKQLGVVGFWRSQVPHMDLHPAMGMFLVPMIFALEVIGLLIKHCVLSIRLMANMLGGHVVLGVFLAFIAMLAGEALWYVVAPASVLASVAMSLLELFVAFLQAYVFTMLTSLFIGIAVHPH